MDRKILIALISILSFFSSANAAILFDNTPVPRTSGIFVSGNCGWSCGTTDRLFAVPFNLSSAAVLESASIYISFNETRGIGFDFVDINWMIFDSTMNNVIYSDTYLDAEINNFTIGTTITNRELSFNFGEIDLTAGDYWLGVDGDVQLLDGFTNNLILSWVTDYSGEKAFRCTVSDMACTEENWNYGFTLYGQVAVPIPPSLPLMASGFIFMGFARRWKTNNEDKNPQISA